MIAAPETEPAHFQPVYIGNPYLAMNIYLTVVNIDGVTAEVGDEIGIFDGDICVGAKVITGPIGQYLALVAATDDPTTSEKDGFTPGNPISYRLWDYSTQSEITNVSTVYTQGDAVFSSQGTAVLELHGSTEQPPSPHFQVVYVGNPYLAMNIYLTAVTIDGAELGVGDEIGIFDDNICVGAKTLTGPIGQYLAMVAATDDPTTPEKDGFTPGNPISYRLWDYSTQSEITNINTVYTMGEAIFSSQGTAVLELHGSSSAPTIQIIAPVADLTVPEDTSDFILTDLDNVFSQPPPGKTVTFSVASDTNAIGVTLNESHVVWVSLAKNWNGVGRIYLRATMDEVTVTDTVQLTVTPVNDPPTAFILLSPAQNATISQADITNFRWTRSYDLDRIGAIQYTLIIGRDNAFSVLDTTIYTGSDTSAAVTRFSGGRHYWKVAAYNTRKDTVWGSGSNLTPWSFEISPVEIKVINPVADLEVAEDASDFQLADLDNVFSQPPPGKTVTFSVASDTNAIGVTLNESHVVWVSLAKNWNGVGRIYLRATMDEVTVTDTVQLTVTPVNDPPTAFILLSPAQNATISQADITNFRWTRSYDLDRIGAIQYTLIIGRDNAFSVLDTTIYTGSDTSAAVTRFSGGRHYWKVAAYNTRKDTVWGSGSNLTPWSFEISPVEIKVINPVADLEVAEDASDFQIADLDNVFSQPPPGKTVTFSVASDTSAIGVTLNESHVVWVSLAKNWNGVGRIYLRATMDEVTVTDTVQLTVTPVNDPPTAFELVSPENDWEGDFSACRFRWSMSSDPDREDTLAYDFSLSRDSSFAILDTMLNAMADTSITLDTLASGKYYWKVCAYSKRDTVWASGSNIKPWSFTIVTVSIDHQQHIITDYRLYSNYPNPFNPTTTFRYELPKDSRVTLSVFDINGREIARLVNETQPAGCYSLIWNASEVGSGVYFYRIQAGEFQQVKKMVLVK